MKPKKFRNQTGAALVMVLMSLLFMGGISIIFAYWLQMESRQVARYGDIAKQQKAMESVTQKEIWRVFHGNSGSHYTWSTLPSGNRTYFIDGATVTVTMEKVGKP